MPCFLAHMSSPCGVPGALSKFSTFSNPLCPSFMCFAFHCDKAKYISFYVTQLWGRRHCFRFPLLQPPEGTQLTQVSIYPFIHFSIYPCCCASLILRWGLHYKKGLSRYRWITWLTAGEGAGCEPQSCCDASHCWGTAHPNRSTLCIAKGILNFKFPWNQDPHKIKL